MQKIKVKAGGKKLDYPIFFPESFEDLGQKLLEIINGRNFLVVSDENTVQKSDFFQSEKYKNCPEINEKTLVLPPGESQKNWQTVEKILEKAFAEKLDRDSVFVAIGGGVIGDAAGFAASVFLRGVDFVNVPTTLLAQVDASIGGKTGIDNLWGKNLIGSFCPPKSVLSAAAFLRSLPRCELQNGLAEMIKHGVAFSEPHFADLEKLSETSEKFSPEKIFALVPDSIQIKKFAVEKDELEQNIRAFLNLGHTFGHAIERLSDFKIPHGRAVAIGTLRAAKFGAARGICSPETVLRIENLFKNFEINLECEFGETEIFQNMAHDKKRKNGKIRLILPEKIGKVRFFEMD